MHSCHEEGVCHRNRAGLAASSENGPCYSGIDDSKRLSLPCGGGASPTRTSCLRLVLFVLCCFCFTQGDVGDAAAAPEAGTDHLEALLDGPVDNAGLEALLDDDTAAPAPDRLANLDDFEKQLMAD
eukprot:gene19847-biopygen824